jgi:predicted permease
MRDILTDLKHAARLALRAPGFTLAVLLALMLGIGANVAIFSIVNTVLLRPLPFREAERIVMFQTTSAQNGAFSAMSPAKFAHFREQASVLQDVAAFRSNVVNYTGGGEPEQLRASQVSVDYFPLFGAAPQVGRTFTLQEDAPDGARAVVLSDAFWTRRFGRDPAVLGRTLVLGGEPYVIVGVIQPGFDASEIGPPPDVWMPFQLDPRAADQGHYFQAAGRLKPGVTLQQAQERIRLSSMDFRQKYPTALQPDNGFWTLPMREVLVGNVRTTLFVLLGAVGCVLLIACANVANLLLARAAGRSREIAIRAAIGADRRRIVRQLLTESALLAVTGGLLGLALGFAGIRALLSVNTAGLPRVGTDGAVVAIDWRVALFTLAVSLATGVLFGVVPALHASRADLGATMKEGGGRSGSGARHGRTRAALVVTEMALAVVLLIGSALLIRTAMALRSVDIGFETSHVLTMRTSLSDAKYRSTAAVVQLVRTGVERLRAIPGVTVASAACCVPLENGYGLPFVISGRPLANGPFHGGGQWLTVSPGYFEVFSIPIRRGRAFTAGDSAQAPGVVIVNEAMARQYWPSGDPLQDRLVIGRGVMREFASERERQIVGIAGNVRDGGLSNEPGPSMYIPQAQVPDPVNALNVRITPMAWVVRTGPAPATLSQPAQRTLREVTGLPVADARPMDEVVSRSISRQRFNMWLMTMFGLAALALAAIGIYGVIAYSVQQRTQEIGIRLALGAGAAQVRRMVVSQGLRLAAAGSVLGVAGAFGLSRLIASLLYGVRAWDPPVFIASPIALLAIALGATWIPAVRASRVDPLEALRRE